MTRFLAFNADGDGENQHRIPEPPSKITRHALRKQEWETEAAANRPASRVTKSKKKKVKRKTVTKVLDAIKYESDELQCLACLLYGDDPACTSKCYTDFTRQSFRPITNSVQIRGPGDLGYSAHTTVPIEKHEWIGEYIGELRPLSLSDTQQSHYWLPIPGQCAIDAERKGNWTRFMNSSCKPNVKVWGETLGKRHVVLFQVLKNIAVGEELTFQYGKAYFEKAGFECRCDAHDGEPHMPGDKPAAKKPAKTTGKKVLKNAK
ncbi:SET domain-containing protein [Karstenula rhodostoma CBS 690.94]|uniref:SET domain-containing protein n=1 Tax=Karstenula rhodostoma CBS 690.94 TaxID=1392251 RepID=A0A9P4U5M9_9PLEO|nr:SET domain-containing protein [Karstenula rhodostoma CBS 690.94]